MRERKLYEKKRAKKGTGRAKTIPVQVSAELHSELLMIKDAYSKCLDRTVTFEQMLRRWIERLPRIDSDVSDEYQVIRKTRLETALGAVSTAREAVSGIFERMQGNGTSPFVEAMNEQEEAKAALEEDSRASAGDSPAPADQGSPEPDISQEGRRRRQESYWFIDPDGNKVKAVIKTIQCIRAFFPEKSSSPSENFRALMIKKHWKMVDDRGNELSSQVAEQILQEFEVDHE